MGIYIDYCVKYMVEFLHNNYIKLKLVVCILLHGLGQVQGLV
jgi:hypothetical protein